MCNAFSRDSNCIQSLCFRNYHHVPHGLPKHGNLTLFYIYLLLTCCFCRGLSWNVHPPTAYCFAKHILALVPKTAVSMTTRQDILELARFLTELCVVDYYFVAKKPSSVALASMVVAMQEIPGSEAVERDFAEYLEKVPGLRLDSPEVLECMERLHLLYSQGGYATSATTATTETREETVSPVCVSYGLPPTQQLASPSAQPSSKVYIHLSAASSTAQFHAVRQGPYGSS